VLDEGQFARFQTFQQRNRSQRPPPAVAVLDLTWNRTTPFYRWLIDVYFFILLPLNCVRMCGALIRDELETDTLGFLTTRPLSRARLLLVKYLSQTAWLEIWMLVQALLLFAAGSLRQIPALGTLIPTFLAVQFLAVLAWGALGLFLGQVSKRYMALALLYGLIVEMGIGRIPTNINTLSLMRHLKTLLGHNADLQGIYHWPAIGAAGPSGALLLAAALFLGLAALMFTFKEYHHTTEMQK
jgi:ABC-type transport system involved in multi-copper enzyme maturation permease subunit